LLVKQIQDWLLSKGRGYATVVELLNGLCVELNRAELSLFRVNLLLPTLHSERVSSVYVWKAGGSGFVAPPKTDKILSEEVYRFDNNHVFVYETGHGHMSEDVFQNSPFYLLQAGWSEVRCRLHGSTPEPSFPILDDLKSMGATDYIAVSLEMVHADDSFISFSTSSSTGFSERDIEDIRSIRSILAQSIEVHSTRISMESVLATYLGPRSAQAVLKSNLRRGDIHTLEAVVGFVDIRGFTESGGLVGNSGLVRRANHFYQCLYDSITPNGGEISKFIGDGALVLFYVDGDPAEASARALLSLQKLEGLIDALNESDQLEHDLGFGVALHLGAVEQGNIGAASRLDFTVIGSTVNLASRFEGLSKRLGRRIVVTQAVANCTPERFEHLGDHVVRGVDGEQAVYGLAEDKVSPITPTRGQEDGWRGSERRTLTNSLE